MSKELKIDLFENSINGLNHNLGAVGKIFHDNIGLLGADTTKEIKENGVNKMAINIDSYLDSFRKNYSDYNEFYTTMKENVKNNTMENEEEYKIFLEHAAQIFPKYIDELGQSIDSMSDIPVKTEKFNKVMKELGSIIENIRFDFKRTLSVADFYDITYNKKQKIKIKIRKIANKIEDKY